LYWLYNDGRKEEYGKVTDLVEQHLSGCRVQAPSQTHDNPAQVMITFEEHGTVFSIATGGGGLRTLLNMASVLHFSESRCLLFDEPDAHLHGTLQREVAQMLQEYAADEDVQIFVATHSPDFISEIPIESLVWIDRQETEGRRCHGLGEFLVGLGSLSKADALRFLGADKVLFVEGGLDRNVLGSLWSKSEQANNPFDDPCVIKACLPSGKGDRKHLAVLQRMLSDAFGLTVKIAALTDADYETGGEVGDSGGPLLCSLTRKEAENYLISPEGIAAALLEANDRSRRPREATGLPDAAKIDELITEVLDKPEIRDCVNHRLVPAYRDGLDRAWDSAKREAEGKTWFEEQWSNPDWRVQRCPGKDVLKLLRSRLKAECGITLTTERLISTMGAFPEELNEIAAQLDGYFYGE